MRTKRQAGPAACGGRLLWLLLVLVSAVAADSPLDAWRQAIQASDINTLQRLAPSIPDIEAGADRGKTALMAAASRGAVALINELVEHGANVNQRNHADGTALMYAAQYGQVQAAGALISHGAEVNLMAMKGWSALMIAVLKQHLPVVELLLAESADVNVQDMHGWTPLMRATERADGELVHRLLQIENINVNTQSTTGTTALHIAAALGRLNIVQLLLDRGVRLDLRDNEGNTAAALAEKGGHQDIAAVLAGTN